MKYPMKFSASVMVAFALILIAQVMTVKAQDKEQSVDMRHFLFIGEPNTATWAMLASNPEAANRQEVMSKAIEKLGGKIHTYYWGFSDGKNYITMSVPNDPELLQAMYVLRKSQGVLESYTSIELMTGAEMVASLKRIDKVKAVDSLPE